MPQILSAIAGVLVVATTASLSAQRPIPPATARRLARATAVIQTTAVNALNSVLANTVVRLRDARLGRIVDQSVTDKQGRHTFNGLDRGNYIVELVSPDQTTLAATTLINVNGGETAAVVVRLPVKPSLLETLLRGQQSSSGPSSSSFGAGGPGGTEVPQGTVPTVIVVGAPVSER